MRASIAPVQETGRRSAKLRRAARADKLQEERDLLPLLVVLGATGSGKSGLSVALAKRFDGEIINCDSVQVYRGLDIGSAKLSREERAGVPHHLIDIADPGENFTAGTYSRLARKAISEIGERGRRPIVVGGTGLYLRALLDGLSPAPQRDEKLRARLTAIAGKRPGYLHRILRRRDPPAAQRIHANDQQKLIRAIELLFLAGQTVTATQNFARHRLGGVRPLKIGLLPDRNLLYRRLNERSAAMFANGLLEETRTLLEGGVNPQEKALQSLGYRQAQQVLAGEKEIGQAVEECQTKTRQYAKRQLTWFRREGGVHWLPGFGWDDDVQAAAIELTQDFLHPA